MSSEILDSRLKKQIAIFKEFGINRPYVTLDEAANVLGLHLNTLRKAVDEGRLQVKRFTANTLRVSIEEVARFIDFDIESSSKPIGVKLPGRLDFTIHHQNRKVWFEFSKPESTSSFRILTPLGIIPPVPKEHRDSSSSVSEDSTILPSIQIVEISNHENGNCLLSGMSVLLKSVVSQKRFSQEEDDSYSCCVEYLRKSMIQWDRQSSIKWSTETLMPDVLEPSIKEGGYSLVPHFVRTPDTTKSAGTFAPTLLSHLYWIPQAEKTALGQKPSSGQLKFLPPVKDDKEEIPNVDQHYIWHGAIILDWIVN